VHALNDSQPQVRFAAMRALGDLRAERAVQALTDQYTYYRKGTGAAAALEALARIGHPSSVPLFKARRSDRDPAIRRIATEGIGRAGDQNEAGDLEASASTESSEPVQAALAFALHRLGRAGHLDRLVRWLARPSMVPQVAGYLVELGPSAAAPLRAQLQGADSGVRLAAADILGMVGGPVDIQALESLKTDRDADVALAASRAIERLRLAGGRGGSV
jgi:HEAT repeat protein